MRPRHQRFPPPRVQAGAVHADRRGRRVARGAVRPPWDGRFPRGVGRRTWMPSGSLDVRTPAPPPSRLALVHRPAAAQSELRIGHVALPRRRPTIMRALVVNMILGGQFVSRINLNLREDKGYTYGARTAFEFRRAPGPFVLQASVQSRRDGGRHREAFAEIRAIRGERPVTDEELEIGRAALTRGYPRNFETADQIAPRRRAARPVRAARRLLHDVRAEGAGADRRRHHARRGADIDPVASAHGDRRRPREVAPR